MGFLYSQLFVKPKYPSESFKGQTVIVTGSNTGLGKEAARHFARLGVSKLILAVRNTSAGENARREIEETTHCGPGVIEVWKLDLASYESVQTFATRAAKDLARIDVLLENAGIAVSKFALAEGHERTVTVNVISTFLLALLLLPKLEATARDYNTHPRLTIVSSEVHGHSKFPEWKAANSFVTLSDQKTANMGERYPTSKLLEVLVCRAIAPKIAERGTGVVLNYLNPGLCHSELSRDGPFIISILKFFLARSTEVGSRTLMAAAEAGPESHGKYMTDGLPNDGALSAFVRSEDGNKASKKIWNELADILEKIHPGVTNPVK
ncbi:alcohol dehydrogenase [Capronia epimyces CBS 606.96]|uniref:Alcohol dehydrogenase n=1 Tax=Capronia epimyces CBS 606.96 TaxID=1182542 RepID=W9YDS8_9EURO|nr:alcohol dehydrogenase [Capronia epimyces CBS 606.96]EXJ87396.1 alcohol dehydrogenase [Capronia epimyces CBS 606.96]